MLPELPVYVYPLLLLIPLIILGLLRRSAPPPLSKRYQSYRVLSNKIVTTGSERPVIFLTIQCSTESLPTGSHIKIMTLVDGQEVTRSYTPTRFEGGVCELAIRVYPDGPMSQYMYTLKEGDTVSIMGPTGIHRYNPPGVFTRGQKQWTVSHIGMICGGTGVTPMIQIINKILSSGDRTTVKMAVFNTTAEDVMLWKRLQELTCERVKIVFYTSKEPTPQNLTTYPGLVHRSCRTLDGDGILEILGVEEPKNSMICMCGPDPFNRHIKTALKGKIDNVLSW